MGTFSHDLGKANTAPRAAPRIVCVIPLFLSPNRKEDREHYVRAIRHAIGPQ